MSKKGEKFKLDKFFEKKKKEEIEFCLSVFVASNFFDFSLIKMNVEAFPLSS